MKNPAVRLGLVTAIVIACGVTPGPNPTRAFAAPPGCPGVPDSNYCLTRVSLTSRGTRVFTFAKAQSYKCLTGATSRIPTTITIDVKGSGPCAQETLFAGPLRLIATGKTIIRSDGLGDFYGQFQMGPPSPTGSGISVVYVSGCIEILERVGSHHGQGATVGCETCDKKPHSEGWIMGTGIRSKFAGGLLRAALVANSAIPVSPTTSASFTPTIDGVWMRK